MRHRSGEQAERFELLRMQQALLQLLALRQIEDEADAVAGAIVDDRATGEDGHGRSIFASNLLFEKRALSRVQRLFAGPIVERMELRRGHGTPVQPACRQVVACVTRQAQEEIIGVDNVVALEFLRSRSRWIQTVGGRVFRFSEMLPTHPQPGGVPFSPW